MIILFPSITALWLHLPCGTLNSLLVEPLFFKFTDDEFEELNFGPRLAFGGK
jgi:hypothetical protein